MLLGSGFTFLCGSIQLAINARIPDALGNTGHAVFIGDVCCWPRLLALIMSCQTLRVPS